MIFIMKNYLKMLYEIIYHNKNISINLIRWILIYLMKHLILIRLIYLKVAIFQIKVL